MRSLADIADRVVNGADADDLQRSFAAPAAEPPAMWLRRIWERMASLYGYTWVNVHGESPHTQSGELSMSGDTWARSLAGITAQQIAIGIRACVTEGGEFPPSAPRFRAMCFNIPRFAAVRSEIGRSDPSPFARAVWQELDIYRFKQAGAEQGDRMLRGAYDVIHDRVMRGERLLEPAAAALEAKPIKVNPATPDQVQRRIAEIRALFESGKDSLSNNSVTRDSAAYATTNATADQAPRA